MDNIKWTKVHTSTFEPEAIIIKDLLEKSEILAVIINKRDSSYNNFGYCEIFVQPSEAMAASDIINEHFNT